MSFLHIHPAIVCAASFLGAIPISPSPSGGHFHRSAIQCTYNILVMLFVVVFFIYASVFEVILKFESKESNGNTEFYNSIIQRFVIAFLFGYLVVASSIGATNHSQFLNLLSDLETTVRLNLAQTNGQLIIVRRSPLNSSRTTMVTLLWKVVFTVLMEATFEPVGNRFVSILFIWMHSVQFCTALYIRTLVIWMSLTAYNQRCCFAKRFESLLSDDLATLDAIVDAKNMFVRTFSCPMLLNFAHDFLTMLTMVFYSVYGVFNFDAAFAIKDVSLIVLAYILPFIAQQFLVVSAMEGFTNEVSDYLN